MQIKETPEDFVVEEVIKLNIKPNGEYSYFLLEKRNWTTLKAIELIANNLNAHIRRFSFAGQKDRVGITKQYVSAFKVPRKNIENLIMKDMKITFVGYGDNPISLGDLEGNKFTILARDLSKPLTKISSFVNYFDDQRFGGYRPNLHLVGKSILEKNYEQAVKYLLLYPFSNETKDYVKARKRQEKEWGKWHTDRYPKYLTTERKIISYLFKNPKDFKGALKQLPRQLYTMTTQSYQSFLWNESLSRYIKETFSDAKTIDYSLGKLFTINNYEDLDWPIVGYKTKLKGKQKEIIEGLMKEEGINYDFFNSEIPALASEGLTRKAFIKIKDFKLEKFENNQQQVSFFLPKGSYATMVMKNL